MTHVRDNLNTHPWEFSSRAIADPVSTSVARIEQSGEPVTIAKQKFKFDQDKNNNQQT